MLSTIARTALLDGPKRPFGLVARPTLARNALALSLASLGALSGCASSETSLDQAASSSASTTGGGGGAGGATSEAATTSSSSATAGGAGGFGGFGGAGGTGGSGGTGGEAGSSGVGGSGGGGGGPVGTAEYPLETETNNLEATANPLAAGTYGFSGAIAPLGDIDLFRVDLMTSGASLRVEVTDGKGGCPVGATTLVRVLTGGVLIASDTSSGVAACSLMTPPAKPTLTNLAAGTYYVQVESAGISLIPSYVVDIRVLDAGCGDGLVQSASGEACDDGNTDDGDGCSSACAIEAALLNETEPNGSLGTANIMTGLVGAIGALTPTGDKDYFKLDVPAAGMTITARTADWINGCPSGMSSKLSLYDPGGAQILTDTATGPVGCSWLSMPLTTAGVYTLRVEYSTANGTAPFYLLKYALK